MFEFILLTVIGYTLYEKYIAGTSLTYKLDSLTFKPVVNGSLPFITQFLLSNPTGESLSINGINGNIYVNGTLLSNVSSTTVATVPANSSTLYPITFSVPISNAVSQIVNIFSNSVPATVSFNGSVNVEGANIPLTDSVTI